MSYSAKFASAFYGPFRNATSCTPEVDNRSSYQLPVDSRTVALRAVQRDIEQEADLRHHPRHRRDVPDRAVSCLSSVRRVRYAQACP